MFLIRVTRTALDPLIAAFTRLQHRQNRVRYALCRVGGLRLTDASSRRTAVSGIPFKPSPFFQVEQPVSAIITCPGQLSVRPRSGSKLISHGDLESNHMQDRKQIHFDFSLTTDQRDKLFTEYVVWVLAQRCSSLTRHHRVSQLEVPIEVILHLLCLLHRSHALSARPTKRRVSHRVS